MTPSVDALRILFIDDEIYVLQAIGRLVRKLYPHWLTYFSSNPGDAITAIRAFSNRLDVIVTDIDMPEVSGVSILRMLKNEYPHIARITLSGRLDGSSLRGSTMYSEKHICKPVTIDCLCAEIISTYTMKRGIVPSDCPHATPR